MPCEHCHKPKAPKFEQGKFYTHGDGERYIVARVLPDKYCLVSLSTGNRYNNPASLENVGTPNPKSFREVSNGN